MIGRARLGRLNDGVMEVYGETETRSERGVDFSTTYGLSKVGSLAFESRTLRDRDTALADAEGFETVRKVRTRRMPSLETGLLCRIGTQLYSIEYIDDDTKSYYVYLDSLATDGYVEFTGESVQRDAIGNRVDGNDEPRTAYCRKRSWDESRANTAPFAGLMHTTTVEIRRCDWDGETRMVRDGVPYKVEKAESKGEWLVITGTNREGTL